MNERDECGAIPPNVRGPVPCHLEPGHDGEHFSTSGCAGSEIRWPRDTERTPGPDMRLPGEAFCSDCPDHEACATAYPCDVVRQVATLP